MRMRQPAILEDKRRTITAETLPSTMKILLKDRNTGLWLTQGGKWETSKNNAQDFHCGTDAIQRAEVERPLDVQVCFEAEDPNLSFELARERGDFLPPRAPVR